MTLTDKRDYQAIPTADTGIVSNLATPVEKAYSRKSIFFVGLGALCLGILLSSWWDMKNSTASINEASLIALKIEEKKIIMPSGVNLGSWLSLEDYFFAGQGSVEVATPFGSTTGACLPPLHIGPSTGPRWNTETDLLKKLWESTSLTNALEIFHAHRTSFIDFETDLKVLADLGVDNVRVPISWCLTDADPILLKDDIPEEELANLFTCKDPFFNDEDDQVYWPAIPKSLLLNFLRSCSYFGIKAVLDIHTYPGGTSIGTFSGVWPRWPRFWTFGDTKTPDIGRETLQGILDWVESLKVLDPEAFEGVRAISIMNEPAHLSGLYSGPAPVIVKESQPPFVPELPKDIAEAYLEKINSNSPSQVVMPDGEHLRVLKWLSDGVDAFRNTKLPSLGVQCHVNVIESIFAPDNIKSESGSVEDLRERTELIAAFWRSATSLEERQNWAVLDYHRYHAWDPQCQGASDGVNGNYTCSDSKARSETLTKCTQWASMYREVFDLECGENTLLASAEFSSSTHHAVRHACQDVSTLLATYKAQTETATAANIELFYWAYQMPYGGAFRNAWSFKQLMYLAGVQDKPDERIYDCAEHISLPDEAHDLSFGQSEEDTFAPTANPTLQPSKTPTPSPSTSNPSSSPSTTSIYCCSWYGGKCGSIYPNFCNGSQSNCEDICQGIWILSDM